MRLSSLAGKLKSRISRHLFKQKQPFAQQPRAQVAIIFIASAPVRPA
ncbi:hypothetical protein [Polaromonas sp. CG9_12]|nr:hypothetical protein [Polaromonas sp. CG9_12]